MDVTEENFDSANIRCNKILTDYSEDPALDKEFKRVICAYWEKGEYAKARELALAVISSQPDNAMCAQAGLIGTDIALGNDQNITEQVDELISDFSDSRPDLPNMVQEIIGEYCNKATQLQSEGVDADRYCYKAVTLWEKIIQQCPDSPAYLFRAYYCLGACYSHFLGDYAKSLENYQKVVDNWPYFDYQRASYAQYEIIRCYQNLEKSGQISPEETANKIRQACNNLLANYPETHMNMVQTARKLLNTYQVSK